MSKTVKRMYSRAKRGAILMEVIIVIAIIAVVAAIAVPSAIGFFSTARSSEVEANARSVFLAAQDYLTNAKKNGTLASVTDVAAQLPPGVLPATVEYQEDLSYLQISKDGANESGGEYMQEILAQYLPDMALAEYTINVEYNIKTGNVFSASFSFDAAHFAYAGGGGTSTGEVGLIDRSLAAREALSFGHYGVDKNVSPAAGGELQQIDVELVNAEALTLRWTDAAPDRDPDLPVTYDLAFTGGTGDVSMTLSSADLNTLWTRGAEADISATLEKTVSVSTPDGTKDIRCWLYTSSENGVTWHNLVLDSIDTSQPAGGKTYPEYSIWNRYPWLADRQISAAVIASADGYESVDASSQTEHSTFATPEEGYTGTDTLIANARHLNNIRYKTADGTYTQVADFGWDSAAESGCIVNDTQITTDAAATDNAMRTLNWAGAYDFTGTYSSAAGSLHTIDGIHILRADGGENTGLFGTVAMVSADDFGTVRDMRVLNANVASSSKGAGIIAGSNLGRIENVTVSGTVSGGSYAGGLVGINDLLSDANTASGNTVGGRIASCTNIGGSVTVTGDYAGGLIGMNLVRDPDDDGTPGFAGYSAGSAGDTLTVKADGKFAGGVLGGNIVNIASNPAFTITAVTRGTGSVTAGAGEAAAGGIVGASYVMNNKNPKSAGTGIGFGTTWAKNNGRATAYVNCENSLNVSATMFAGGIVGYNSNSSDIYFGSCKNSGNVALTTDRTASDSYIGGMTGRLPAASGGNRGLAENCENSGRIDGHSSNNVGGIVGWSRGRITGCRNTGDVISTGYNIGGIVGSMTADGFDVSIANCTNAASSNVTGRYNVGGFIGRYEISAMVQSELTGLTNYASVASTDTDTSNDPETVGGGYGNGGTGGVVGNLSWKENKTFAVINCINRGAAYSRSDAGGGVVGRLLINGTASVTGCANYGRVGAAVKSAGGVIGLVLDKGASGSLTVSNCSNGSTAETASTYDVRGTGNWFGGVIGYLRGSSTNLVVNVSNCTNYSNIEAAFPTVEVGGILGRDANGRTQISNCRNYGSISGAVEEAGGILGYGFVTNVTDCHNTGAIGGSKHLGGIVGSGRGGSGSDYTIINCTNSGAIGLSNLHAGEQTVQMAGVGGIIGYLRRMTLIAYCTNSGAVGNDTSINTGGIAGNVEPETDGNRPSNIENCNNSGEVRGRSSVGGIAGYIASLPQRNPVNISACTNTGAVRGALATATDAGGIGGIVGRINNGIDGGTAAIDACTNTAVVTAEKGAAGTDTSEGVGGVVGWSSGANKTTVNNCTNSGRVLAENCNAVGGIAGVNEGRIVSCSTATPTDWTVDHIVGHQGVGGIAGESRRQDGIDEIVSITSTAGDEDYVTTNVLNVRGWSMVGGIVGYNQRAAVANMYNTGRVTAAADEKRAGGIIGYLTDTIATVDKSVSRGSFGGGFATPTNCVGGVIGYLEGVDSRVSDCYSYGDNVPETDVNATVAKRDFGNIETSTIASPPNVDWEWTDSYIKRWIAGLIP